MVKRSPAKVHSKEMRARGDTTRGPIERLASLLKLCRLAAFKPIGYIQFARSGAIVSKSAGTAWTNVMSTLSVRRLGGHTSTGISWNVNDGRTD